MSPDLLVKYSKFKFKVNLKNTIPIGFLKFQVAGVYNLLYIFIISFEMVFVYKFTKNKKVIQILSTSSTYNTTNYFKALRILAPT